MSEEHRNNSNSRRQNANQSTGRRNQSVRNNRSNRTDKPKLKGEIEELGSNVYFIGSFKQSDNYETVTEAICNYILRKMEHGEDIVKAIMDGTEVDFDAMIDALPVVPITSSANQIAASN